MPKEVSAFFWVEEIACIADGVDEAVEGSGADASEVGLELCEGHFDGIEVRTVWREEEEPAASVLQGCRCCGVLVGAEIVEDDDGSGFEQRRELGLNICGEGGPVHGAFDDPGRDEGVGGQPCDESLGAPFAEGRCGREALAPWRAAAQAGQIGLDRGLVDEDQPVRLQPHPRLTATYPIAPGAGDVSALSFVRDQRFFL